MSNFIDRFIEIVEKMVDSPRDFIEGAGLSLISSTLGRFHVIGESRGKHPQTFVVLCSAPGLGRRGELNKCFNIVLKSAISTYVKKKFIEDEEIKKQYAAEKRAMFLEGGSEQGLIDIIEELKDKGVRGFLLNASEFGDILDSIRTGGYMHGLNKLFCKLWSEEYKIEDFSHRDPKKPHMRVLREGTYFCILGFMQKAEDYLVEEMSKVGLLRRLLIIDKKGTEMTRHLPAISEEYDGYVNQLEELGNDIGKRMYELSEGCKTVGTDALEGHQPCLEVIMDSDVKDEINRIEEKLHTDAKMHDKDPYFLYQQSRWEYILKLATCYSIADCKLVITKDYLDKAFGFNASCNENIEPIIRKVLVTEIRRKYLADKERFYTWLLDHGESKTSDISRGLEWLGLTAAERLKILEDLKSDGKVTSRTEKIKGNEVTWWKAVS
jgi:hypothetical protein